MKSILSKVNKAIELLWKLQNILPGALFTIFKSFVRPHLHYRDITNDQSSNNTFHHKMESTNYNAAQALYEILRKSFVKNLV